MRSLLFSLNWKIIRVFWTSEIREVFWKFWILKEILINDIRQSFYSHLILIHLTSCYSSYSHHLSRSTSNGDGEHSSRSRLAASTKDLPFFEIGICGRISETDRSPLITICGQPHASEIVDDHHPRTTTSVARKPKAATPSSPRH